MVALWPGLTHPAISYISPPPSEGWQGESPRSLVILGSTGSIGRNALSVVEAQRAHFTLIGLSCARRVETLAAQATTFRPPYLAVLDEESAGKLRKLLPSGYNPEILTGSAGYAKLAALPEASTVLSAQVGAAGLAGTLAAALAGKVICLANKESLVLAGSAVREICARTGAAVLPVDSEHNAIFQCLAGRGQEIHSLILTASGGPFFGKSGEELRHVTREQALNHPNWRMGAKISIDSATMMNKGLEIVEACHLYGMAQKNVRVLVHPQSVAHSLVEMADGSLLAQMGIADMRLPLAHCLLWPRCEPVGAGRLDLAAIGALTFLEPNTTTFPCLELARAALEHSEGLCIVMNAANEAAVELFLNGLCAFTDISELIAATMENHGKKHNMDTATLPGDNCLGAENFAALAREVDRALRRIEALGLASRAFVHNLVNIHSAGA